MADYVDVFGFAGGFAMGMTQAGHHLIGKKEGPGGFGVPNMMANRHLLGHDWQPDVRAPHEWAPSDAPLITGNPPCSGFSLLSSKAFRGINSPANSCMHEFTDYAVRCGTAPQIIAFESVAQAYKQGRPLMQQLREKMEIQTGERWDLYHVLHNALSVGGAALRRRYFFVCTRGGLPFGVEDPIVERVPTLLESIGDLMGMGDTWEEQPYRQPATWWSKDLRRDDGLVDGHATKKAPHHGRVADLMAMVEWEQGEPISNVARRCYEMHGRLPDSWAGAAEKLIRTDFKMGFNQTFRWRGGRVARVVTGGALILCIHPVENRAFTHREVARIQGFPDDWRIKPLQGVSGLDMTWGKGIPVQCGKWLGGWLGNALDGNPGSVSGELIGDRERLIDVTNAYRMSGCPER